MEDVERAPQTFFIWVHLHRTRVHQNKNVHRGLLLLQPAASPVPHLAKNHVFETTRRVVRDKSTGLIGRSKGILFGQHLQRFVEPRLFESASEHV